MGHQQMRCAVILLSLVLAGCATTGSTQSLKPVCDALIGPITYNSHNKNSDWHAGKKLVPELAKRNRVGINLHCPAYK